MLKLEELKKDAQVLGLAHEQIAKIVSAEAIGPNSVTVIYRTTDGKLGERQLFRSDETNLELAAKGRAWAFDAPATEFKLGLEAFRISLAHLFDPMAAVHSSNVEPLPHQISAVYESMLPRQPLRYLLADDPGSGKTIMAGLYIRELMIRADARRILIIAPDSLVEQWQDELNEKFGTAFTIFTREMDNVSKSGNPFEENDRLIARIDQLSRNDDLLEKLRHSHWDLVVVDEAHKMSANYYGQKVNETKRFKLGKLIGGQTRHFLLMTATPHNGKDADFQLFLSLLDGDRFYGKFREGTHQVDTSDMMRRMVKEDMRRFDGSKLFPERIAYTANYTLSGAEAALYADVTDYVREQFNLADQLDDKRKGTVGFALTLLQRRLASSPAAIYQSLKRRKQRLENRLEEEKLIQRGHGIKPSKKEEWVLSYDEIDGAEDDLSGEEYEELTETVVDQATASKSIFEFEKEIIILTGLVDQAKSLAMSGEDKKWEELSMLLQDQPEMRNESGRRRKLIIFTEHKDTLYYLQDRIIVLLGDGNAVGVIHGGVNRDDRRKVQDRFRQDKELIVLLATDAAGEGVNLQNANLMINYDLPWNPNRLEQRFGRIHRIGQTEVCHLWNLVAKETREGEVFKRLFDKLNIEREALQGRVFDILGEAFEGVSLKRLLIDAIRYGEQPGKREEITKAIDGIINTDHFKELIQRNALCEEQMSMEQLYPIKEEMEKAQARKLQPYFIQAFFTEAFATLGGELKRRENGRFEIGYVHPQIRERDRVIGESRSVVLKKYERVCFQKEQIKKFGKPDADLLHPGHPLMHAVTDLVLEANRARLKQGAILVDPTDEGTEPRILFTIDHAVKEGGEDKPREVSRRLQFVAINQAKEATFAGWAPHLDYRSLEEGEDALVKDILHSPWLQEDLDSVALSYASQFIADDHFNEVKLRREKTVDRTLAAVHQRLTTEIKHWSDRYWKLTDDVKAGKQPKLQPINAQQRVNELTARLESRKKELAKQRAVVSSPPVILGGALVIPIGLLDARSGKVQNSVDADAKAKVERMAMKAVEDAERAIGNHVKDVGAEKCGWDITGRPPQIGEVLPLDRHIEVKGRSKGQTTITVSRNEILYALNQSDQFILAIVIVEGETFEGPFYVKRPFTQEPDTGVASINYDLKDLLARSMSPDKSL